MHLTVFNGSPKLGMNNTEVLVNAFIEGYENNQNAQSADHGQKPSHECHKLNQFKSLDEAAAIFHHADCVLLAFPLYSYAMPAGVKAFIEALGEHDANAKKMDGTDGTVKDTVDGEQLAQERPRKKLGFIVQYGFVEAIHARPLEGYLKQVTEELNCTYLGTVIKGGCDSLATRPKDAMNKKTIAGARTLGEALGKVGELSEDALNQYAAPETQLKKSLWIMKIVTKLINQFYWKASLKKNGALSHSFDRPYGA